jgi:alcohol dehydrogenase (cytochrome c)
MGGTVPTVLPKTVALILTAAAQVQAQIGPTQGELLRAPTSSDWLYATHDYSGQRFADLKQITPANARSLRAVCAYQVSDVGSFQTSPIVYRGVMYLTTRYSTVAIDAATCRERWRHPVGTESSETTGVGILRRLLPNRGVALKDGKVVRGTPDGRLLALDAASGALLWERQVADSAIGEMVTMPPLIFEDLVLAGPAVSEVGIRGWIGAFRLSDGEPVWKFNVIPEPGAPGSETWENPESRQHGGGGVWTPFSLDPDEGLLFVATGNPAPDIAGEVRPGANLFTNSLVVLDVRTGALRWYRQMVPHDVHDWDLTQAGPLFTGLVGGSPRRLIATAGKDGMLRVLDRRSHELLYEVAVTTRMNLDVPITKEGVRACPGLLGGVQWNGPAFNPQTGLLYVPAVDWCTTYSAADSVRFVPGEFYVGGTIQMDSVSRAAGWLTAVEAATGKVGWRYRSGAPMVAGVTTTSGGVVFTGESSGDFLVLNARNGEVLYRFYTGGPVGGGVITYTVSGRQLVAVMSGSLPIFERPPGSATVFIFGLP